MIDEAARTMCDDKVTYEQRQISATEFNFAFLTI